MLLLSSSYLGPCSSLLVVQTLFSFEIYCIFFLASREGSGREGWPSIGESGGIKSHGTRNLSFLGTLMWRRKVFSRYTKLHDLICVDPY
jgi:hypothetical protein